MNELTVKRQYNLQTWTNIISECTNSGMTIKDWCASNDIQPARFYYWKKQIQEELAKSNAGTNTFFLNLKMIFIHQAQIRLT